jgi:DNA-binding CsgD family transcriptional regulator
LGIKRQLEEARDSGLFITDESLRILACDAGAVSIVNPAQPQSVAPGSPLPAQLAQALNELPAAEDTRARTVFDFGGAKYVVRVYALRGNPGLANTPTLAIHLDRTDSDHALDERINELIEQHGLTPREQQTLRYLVGGLSTTEMAKRMGVAPNTAKALVRLLRVRIGASTRAEILARVLSRQTTHEPQPRRR